MSETDFPRETPVSGRQYLATQGSPEFQELRNRLRRFVFPMSALFLIWYFAYVLLGAFAHDFMAIRVWGNINVGLLIGLGDQELNAEFEVRSLTGIGAEKAIAAH